MQGICFDLDGTLIDSLILWGNIDRLYIESKGLKYDPSIIGDLKKVQLMESKRIFSEHYKDTNFDDITEFFFDILFEYYAYKFELKKAVKEKIIDFKKKGFKTAITTAAPLENVKALLKRYELSDYIDIICTSETMGMNKKNIDFFKLACEKLGTNLEDTYVFDDSLYAIKFANELNMISVGVYDPSQVSDEEEMKRIAKYYINGFDEIDFI